MYTLTPLVDFNQLLHFHLKFIKNSCDAYDRGDIEEALRIAVSLRVLFHDTEMSVSLLTHLSKRNSVKLSTTAKSVPSLKPEDFDIGFFIPQTFGNTLEFTRSAEVVLRTITAVAWWEEPVYHSAGTIHLRKDVVLKSANEHGGAHVQSSPSKKALSLKTSFGTVTRNKGGVTQVEDIANHHLTFLRQFGYEVLNSPDLVL